MSNLVTVNSGSAVNGSLKAGRVSISTDSSITPTSGGKTWYNMINPAEGYVFVTDGKVQGYGDAPIIYPTQTTLPADILATINGLPDRVGSQPFDNVWDALAWVRNTGKYFPLTKTYSGFPTDGLQVLVDGSNPFSSPGSGSNWYDLMNGAYFFPDNNPPTFHYDGYWDFEDSNNPGDNFKSSGTPNSNTQTQYTRLAFFNPETLDGNFKNLYCNVIGNNADMSLCVSNSKVSFHQYTTTSDYTVEGTTVLSTGRWYFGAIVVDRSSNNLKIYLDGVLDREATISTIGNSSSNTQLIGGPDNDSYGGARMFDGKIALAAHYNRLLDASEIAQAYYGAPIVTDNLVLGLDASNIVSYPKSGTTGYDLVGSYDGTLTNGVAFSNDNGGYWDFDGVDDYISIPTYTFGNGDWTLSMWVNVDNFSQPYLMSNSSGGPVANVFAVYGSKIFYQNYDGAWQTHYGNTTLSTGKWYLLTWVNYAGASANLGTMKMYVNGVADSATFNSYTTNGGPCNIIGGYYGSTKFNGKIANVYIQTKALTDLEVQQNYNAKYPQFESSRRIPTEGLSLHIDPTNPSSYLAGSTAYDLSGQGHNGTLTNGAGYTTENGGVWNLDGVDDYINLGYQAILFDPSATNFSTGGWIWINAHKNYNTLIQLGGTGAAHNFLGGNNSGYIEYRTRPASGTSIQQVASTGPVTTNQWHHIFVVCDTTNAYLYIDGVLNNTGTLSGMPTTTYDQNIGYYRDSSLYHNGKIGDVRLYLNNALTSQEILNLYTSQAPRYQVQTPRSITNSLVLSLDAGDTTSYPRTGTTWYDRSGQGFNGTLTNSPTYNFTKGGKITFDGVDDWVDLGNPTSGSIVSFTENFTIEQVFSPTGYQPSNYYGLTNLLLLKGNLATVNYLTQLNSSTQVRFTKRGNAESLVNYNFTVPSMTNNINHLVFVVEGNTKLHGYMNGEFLGTYTIGGQAIGPGTNNDPFRISWPSGGDMAFIGDYYLAKLYNKALSPSEVLENYKATRSRFGTDGIVTSNLQIYLDAGNPNSYTNGSTTWTDLSGNSNNFSINNSPSFNSKNGGTLTLDGVDDFATKNISSITNDFTYAAWVRSTNISGWRTIVDQDNDDWLLATNGGVIQSYDPTYSSGYTIETNQWYYICMSHSSGGPVKIYVNGNLEFTSGNNATSHTTSTLNIGAGNIGGSPNELWVGDIALVKIYNTALTDAQILQNYKVHRNRFGTP